MSWRILAGTPGLSGRTCLARGGPMGPGEPKKLRVLYSPIYIYRAGIYYLASRKPADSFAHSAVCMHGSGAWLKLGSRDFLFR